MKNFKASPSEYEDTASPFAIASMKSRLRLKRQQEKDREQREEPNEAAYSSVSKEDMDVVTFNRKMLNVITSATPQTNESTSYVGNHVVTPNTMRAKRKNKWEQAADLMFRKQGKQAKSSNSTQDPKSAQYQRHVQRMLLGRVKNRSEKKFDILRKELLLTKQPHGVIAAASKSMAGFKIALAIDNLVKKRLRCGFYRWHRILREHHVERAHNKELQRQRRLVEWLKDALTRKHEALVRMAARSLLRTNNVLKRRCLTGWRFAAMVSAHNDFCAENFRRRGARKCKLHILRTWRHLTELKLQEDDHSSAVNELNEKYEREIGCMHNSLCRRVVRRMLHAKLNAAMNAWREFSRTKALLQRIGKRWMRQGLVRCLNRWRQHTRESRRLRTLCKRVGARWLKANLVFIMSKWKSFVESRLHDKGVVKRWLAAVKNREITAGSRLMVNKSIHNSLSFEVVY